MHSAKNDVDFESLLEQKKGYFQAFLSRSAEINVFKSILMCTRVY